MTKTVVHIRNAGWDRLPITAFCGTALDGDLPVEADGQWTHPEYIQRGIYPDPEIYVVCPDCLESPDFALFLLSEV